MALQNARESGGALSMEAGGRDQESMGQSTEWTRQSQAYIKVRMFMCVYAKYKGLLELHTCWKHCRLTPGWLRVLAPEE